MSNEVEVMDAVAVQNYQAAHSVMVMEQWGTAAAGLSDGLCLSS